MAGAYFIGDVFVYPVSEFLQVQHMGNCAGVTCAKSRNGKWEDILKITQYTSAINGNKLINCGFWCIICGERNILVRIWYIDTLSEDPANIYSFLLVAGYLKNTSEGIAGRGGSIYVRYRLLIEKFQTFIRVKFYHICCRLEQSQGLLKIRLRKVFTQMILRSCSRRLRKI